MKKFNFKRSNCGGTHVYVLFIDGEINSTKAGDLLGQRSMHLSEAAVLDIDTMARPKALLSQFPDSYNSYPCIYIDEKEQANEYRQYLYDSIDTLEKERMYEYLKDHDYLNDEAAAYNLLMADIPRLTMLYNNCKGNQIAIRSCLNQHMSDAKDNKDELRIAYIKECQQSEVVDWNMLEESRGLKDA